MNNGKTEVTRDGLTLNFSPVTAEKIITPEESAKNGVQTTKHRVQLRQHVATLYPAARSNSLYSADEFGKGQSYEEKRVTWMNVPATATLEEITKRINEMDSPKLVRTLSLKPILTEDQLRTIDNGVNPKTLEDYYEDFVVDNQGNAVFFKGQKQYRRISFSKSWVEDNDNRLIDYNEVEAQSGVQLAQSQNKVPQTL